MPEPHRFPRLLCQIIDPHQILPVLLPVSVILVHADTYNVPQEYVYTKEELAQFIATAKAYGVTVVPEKLHQGNGSPAHACCLFRFYDTFVGYVTDIPLSSQTVCLKAPVIEKTAEGGRRLAMPETPDGFRVTLIGADLEQVIGSAPP